MTKKTTYLLYAVQGLLTLLFLFTGIMKLALPAEVLTKQSPLPVLFLRFIGVCEVLGGLALALPGLLRIKQGLTVLAAGGLAIIMAGATAATLAVGGGAAAIMPVVVGLLLVWVARQVVANLPSILRVERSIRMQAAPETIFAILQDFRQWSRWSPYERLDPAMQKTFSGADRGVGAVYEWAGNRKAGAGRMEIVDVTAHSRIHIRLDFSRPFEGHNTAEFTITTAGAGSTTVTWATYGPQKPIARVMATLVSMDGLIGTEFEKGLENLKAVAERETCLEVTA